MDLGRVMCYRDRTQYGVQSVVEHTLISPAVRARRKRKEGESDKGRESESLEAGLRGRETCSPGKKRGEVPAGAVGSGRPIHHAVPSGIREGHTHTMAVCSGLHVGEENVTCSFRYKQLIHTPLLSFLLSRFLFSFMHLVIFFKRNKWKYHFDGKQRCLRARGCH